MKLAPTTRRQASDTSASGAAADVNRRQPPMGSESDGDSPLYGPSESQANNYPTNSRQQRRRRTVPPESASRNNNTETTSGEPRRRIKWTNEMNEFIIRNYFRVLKNNYNTSGYAVILRELFVQEYPIYETLTVQNITDRKNYILNESRQRRPIPQVTIDQIRREVDTEFREISTVQTLNEDIREHRNTIQIVNTTENATFDNNTNEIPTPVTHLTIEPTTDTEREQEARIINEKLQENIMKYKDLNIEIRPKLPKLQRTMKLIKLTSQINSILPEFTNQIENLKDLQNITYCVAITITEICLGKTFTNDRNNNTQTQRIPSWMKRLEDKISTLRKDLGRLTQYHRGNRSQKLLQNINKIKKKYKQHSSHEEHNKRIEEFIDTIKQKLTLYSKRLKKYKTSQSRKNDNAQFHKSEKTFYKTLQQREVLTGRPPSQENIENFWSNIWSVNTEHTKEANWIPTIEQESEQIPIMETYSLNSEQLQQIISKMHNWKCPGPDGIHNYWIKKLTTLHPIILNTINHLIENPENIPEELCTGNTYLKSKDQETENPAKYRPITCLNNLYKLITASITTLIQQHCQDNNIIYEEQKGSRPNTMGCKEQLLIDEVITNQAIEKQRNLSTAYIDYKKAYDMIPHSWILYTLKLYKINSNIINFIEKTMQKWNTKLIMNNQMISNTIKIKRGIFQGDSMSGLLFCIALNPLSTILNEVRDIGYKIKGNNIQYNITHLMYMDDIKLYAPNIEKLKNLLKIVETYSNDIKMEFGINKCKLQNITKGKFKVVTPYTTQDERDIEQLQPDELYKYLGMMQSKKTEHSKIKDEITKNFSTRLKKLMKTHLNSRNLTKAINTFAIPILTYSFGIINWSNTDIEALERKIRTTMTNHKKHHPKSALERPFIPRYLGGRGIIPIKDLHEKQKYNLSNYFWKRRETSKLHQTIISSDIKYTPCQLNSPPNKPTPINRIREWQAKPMHGKYPNEINNTEINKQGSLKWLTSGKLFPETEGFIISMQDGVTPTRHYRKVILKQPIESDQCRKCNQSKETLEHILGGCVQLAQNEYKNRHDNMGKIIHLEIAKKIKLIKEPIPPDHQYIPKPVLQNEQNTYILYWDRSILTDIMTISNRPDVILWDKEKSKVYLIDFAVVNSNNLEKTKNQKITKYQQLAYEIKRLWNVNEVIIIPIILSTLGLVPQFLTNSLLKLNLPINIINRLQHSVLLSSAHITRKFLDMS